MFFCNTIVPQILWIAAAAAQASAVLFVVSLLVLMGMWLERYMIITHQPAPRLSAVVVGHVQADDLGLA